MHFCRFQPREMIHGLYKYRVWIRGLYTDFKPLYEVRLITIEAFEQYILCVYSNKLHAFSINYSAILCARYSTGFHSR